MDVPEAVYPEHLSAETSVGPAFGNRNGFASQGLRVYGRAELVQVGAHGESRRRRGEQVAACEGRSSPGLGLFELHRGGDGTEAEGGGE